MVFQQEILKLQQEYLSGSWKEQREHLKQKIVSRPIILYGLGFFGAVIVRNFAMEGIPVECFCDSKKRGFDPETNLEIISPEKLADQYSDANIVISVANPSTEESVYKTILSLGIDRGQIFRFQDAYQFMRKSRVEQVSLDWDGLRGHLDGYERAYQLFSDHVSQTVVLETLKSYLFNSCFTYDPPGECYFPTQFSFGGNEVFIDGGLYTGDTTEEFIRRTDGKYSKIIGFDIDQKNLAAAYKNLALFPRTQIIAKGLWAYSATKTAELGITAGSNIKEGAADMVDLVSLDELFENIPQHEYPTFIKLDVEGSEKQALLGAENIIRTAAPKMAVCAYHRPEDIYVLSELLLKFHPEYKLFLRHYSPYIWDTVLYAYE